MFQSDHTGQEATFQSNHTGQEAKFQSDHTGQEATFQSDHTGQEATFQSNHTAQEAKFQSDHTDQVAEFQGSNADRASEFQGKGNLDKQEAETQRDLAPPAASPPVAKDTREDGLDLATREECSMERRATLLNRRVLKSADIMRLVKAKDIRITGTKLDHNLQQRGFAEDGIYELLDELDGYLSSGGRSMSVHHTVIELVVSAVQAEQPNLAVIKANQDAYDKVIQTSEEFLSDQRREYEAQRARMLLAHKAHEEQIAQEHQRVMDKIKAENEKIKTENEKMLG
jgi:hypothetical protein